MGQQQLLLLVLGIVVVGIAVIVGIQSFAEGKHQSALDEAHLRTVNLATEARAWKSKPGLLGGGANQSGLTSLTVQAVGYEVTSNAGGDPRAGDGNPWRFAFHDTDTATPFVTVHYFDRGSAYQLAVSLYLFGSDEACWLSRTAQWSNGALVWQPVPTAPAGCSW